MAQELTTRVGLVPPPDVAKTLARRTTEYSERLLSDIPFDFGACQPCDIAMKELSVGEIERV